MGTLLRRCRSCGRTLSVPATEKWCPACQTEYGPIEFGMDLIPGEAARLERVRQADTDRRFNEQIGGTASDDTGLNDPE